MKAASILAAVLDKLSPIWPSPMGDVWQHPVIGLVPFHKLSQWLSYSLVEPIEGAGLKVVELDALTGLPEYRNGGLLVDAGALRPKQSSAADRHLQAGRRGDRRMARAHGGAARPGSPSMCASISASMPQRLPLVKVLEAGTWFAGRTLAAERRPGGGPPIAVDSDGTVF